MTCSKKDNSQGFRGYSSKDAVSCEPECLSHLKWEAVNAIPHAEIENNKFRRKMPQYTLRIATISDTQAVTELLHASYPKLMQSAYDASVLSATLPAIAQANPVLLASKSFYLVEN